MCFWGARAAWGVAGTNGANCVNSGCNFLAAHHVQRMNTCRTVPAENGFQIIEIYPDVGRSFVALLANEAGAQP